MILKYLVQKTLDLHIPTDVQIDFVGLADSTVENTLTFLDDKKFSNVVIRNKCISAVLTNELIANELANELKNIFVIISPEPRHSFYLLHNAVTRENKLLAKSLIDSSAKIHPSAYIAEYNVVISEGVIVGPNTTIHSDVIIGKNVEIGSNTTLGCEGAEVKNTSKGLLRVEHDGKLIIENNVSIGSNCTVDKGFKNRDTVIGFGTVLANQCMIAHSAKIGKNCLLIQCIICGSVVVGDNVRINPGAVVSNQVNIGRNANVGLGTVVIKDVKEDANVSGYYAMDHNKHLYKYVKLFGKI